MKWIGAKFKDGGGMVTFDHTLLCKACVRWEQLLPGGSGKNSSFRQNKPIHNQ